MNRTYERHLAHEGGTWTARVTECDDGRYAYVIVAMQPDGRILQVEQITQEVYRTLAEARKAADVEFAVLNGAIGRVCSEDCTSWPKPLTASKGSA